SSATTTWCSSRAATRLPSWPRSAPSSPAPRADRGPPRPTSGLRASHEAQALLQRTHAVARHGELHARLTLQAQEQPPPQVGVQLGDRGDVDEDPAVDAEEPRGVELSLEVGEGRVEHVLGRARHRVGGALPRHDVIDLIDGDELDAIAEPRGQVLEERRWAE